MKNNITQFGIYIKSNHGYVPMTTINNANYPEFKHLKKATSIEREDDDVTLIIYSNHFDATYFKASIRKLALKGSSEDLNFSISLMDKENMYQLTTNTKVPNGSFIFIQMGWDEISTVFLGDAQKEAVTFFSNIDLQPAYAASQDLETTINIFPDNEQLVMLLPKWGKLKKQEKEITDYKYVEDVWKQYQESEKITLKVRYLEKLQVELNGFLNNHPDGIKLTECKEKQVEIDTKLPEYEKMI